MGAPLAFLLMVALLLLGCSGNMKPVNLPAPEFSTTLGPSDEFELRIVPTRDGIPKTFQVQPDGTVSVPYLDRIKVSGLEPHEVEKLVRDELIKREIFTDPSVSVVVAAYRSKKVEILGQVNKPDAYPFTPGMTLLRLVSLAGGTKELADSDSVTIRRKMKSGETRVVEVSIDDILANRMPDIPLQAGDSVNVAKTML
jgi:protein involved in polysaccharide export with SLBB domain